MKRTLCLERRQRRNKLTSSESVIYASLISFNDCKITLNNIARE